MSKKYGNKKAFSPTDSRYGIIIGSADISKALAGRRAVDAVWNPVTRKFEVVYEGDNQK